MFEILAKIQTSSQYTCGTLNNFQFSGMIPYVVSTAVTIIKIVVPILLIIWGMLDLAKAVMAQKEDEIKKGQQTFIKRLIAAVIVFFVITVVQMIITFVSGSDTTVTDCFNCFVNGEGCDEYSSHGGSSGL